MTIGQMDTNHFPVWPGFWIVVQRLGRPSVSCPAKFDGKICGIFDTLMIDIRQISVSTSISKLKKLNIDVLSPLHSLQEVEDQLPFIPKNISQSASNLPSVEGWEV